MNILKYLYEGKAVRKNHCYLTKINDFLQRDLIIMCTRIKVSMC